MSAGRYGVYKGYTMRGWSPLLALLLILSLPACLGGAAEKALQNNLQGIVKTVQIADGLVTATCVNDVVVTVDEVKLEPAAPGGASKEGLARVMQAIQAGCEAPAVAAQKEQREQKRFQEECKNQKIKCSGKASDMRATLCEKLSAELPLRGERRERAITRHAKNWGCADPGPPKLGPNGYWEIESSGRGKKRIVTARLDSDLDAQGAFGRLSIRCQGRKGEMYLAERFQLPQAKKMAATVDEETFSWEVGMSTDRKAVFIKDPKNAVADLKNKKQLSLSFRLSKQETLHRRFPIEGIEHAVKKLGRRCKL